MAAKHATKVDEPIKEILDNIHEGHIKGLTKDLYGGDASRFPPWSTSVVISLTSHFRWILTASPSLLTPASTPTA